MKKNKIFIVNIRYLSCSSCQLYYCTFVWNWTTVKINKTILILSHTMSRRCLCHQTVTTIPPPLPPISPYQPQTNSVNHRNLQLPNSSKINILLYFIYHEQTCCCWLQSVLHVLKFKITLKFASGSGAVIFINVIKNEI